MSAMEILHLEQLREFVERPAAQPGAHPRHPGILAHLEQYPGPVVEGYLLGTPCEYRLHVRIA